MSNSAPILRQSERLRLKNILSPTNKSSPPPPTPIKSAKRKQISNKVKTKYVAPNPVSAPVPSSSLASASVSETAPVTKSPQNNSYTSPQETSISIYLLFLYLFIICMYCLFSHNSHGNKSQNNLESLGYVLFIVFQILLFFFILWKLFVSFFKGGDKSILEKGFNLVEYIEQMTNSTNLNIFGKYTAGLYSATIFTSILIFFIFFIYLIIHKSKSGNAIQLFIMFFALIIAIISGIVYRKITIPLVAIIGIGIILNGITSLMAGSTLVNIPTSERSQGALDISDISKEKLNQYKIISIMCIFILFALSVILFTKEFTLNLANIPNTNIYKYNNGIAILFSTVLIILSSYNIYNTNALITSIHPMQVIT